MRTGKDILPIANNKLLLMEASIKLCHERLLDVLPMLSIVAEQHKLNLNKPMDFRKASIIYVKSLKQN